MTVPQPPPSYRRLLRLGVAGAWLLFTVMVVAISWAGSALRGRRFDVGNTLLWNAGWLLWAGGTFVVASLARRFPLERTRLARSLARHAAFSLAVAAAILGIECALNAGFERVWPGYFRPTELLGFFVYKFHIYVLIYWLVVGATQALDYYAQVRATELRTSQLEARLAQAQLQALKMQLHPHFLFNTHHAIISLMMKQENDAAITMLTRLSDLLRFSLRQTDRQVMPLREELAALDLYLGIQRERYRDQLVVERAIAAEALDAEVPCLILQPLVENAVQHGIEATGSGRIRLEADCEAGRLILRIADDGPGLPAGFTLESAAGVGLANTAARLERLYGSQQTLQIQSAPGRGTEVRLELPWRRADSSASETVRVPA